MPDDVDKDLVSAVIVVMQLGMMIVMVIMMVHDHDSGDLSDHDGDREGDHDSRDLSVHGGGDDGDGDHMHDDGSDNNEAIDSGACVTEEIVVL